MNLEYQIVWVLVTLQAVAVEGVEHVVVMGLFVAVATLRYRWVFALVAEGAVEGAMLGLALGQHLKNFGMTGPAVFRFDVIGVLDVEGAVWFMTAQTIVIGEKIGVWGMTFQASLDLLMLGRMTEGAIFGGVFAGEGLKFLPLLRVAGLADQADRRHIVNGDIQRGVRVAVATKTIRHLKMLLAAWSVTHGALGNGLGA